MKKVFNILLVFIFIILFISCKETKYVISGDDSVEVGCSILLKTNIPLDNQIIWRSSDDEIASVIDGMVIGNKEGEVTIYVEHQDNILSKKILVTKNIIDITIIGVNNLYIGQTHQFSYQLSKELDLKENKVKWTSSDETVVSVDMFGLVSAKSNGSAIIKAELFGNVSEFEINVSEISLAVISQNKVKLGDSFDVKIKTSSISTSTNIKYKSSNEEVFTVDDNGKVTGVSLGRAVLTAYLASNPNIKATMAINVVDYSPLFISISGDQSVTVGNHLLLELSFVGDGSKEVIWSSLNESVAICYQGIVLGLKPGNVTIKATSVSDKDIYATYDIEVKELENKDNISEADFARANQILSKMTLSQKIGQMLVAGFNGTEINQSLINGIKNYNIGNVIYMAYNVSNPDKIANLSNNIQNEMVKENGVPGFISIDQEGGRVARLTNGGTHFISQMAMCATGDYNNTYLEAKAIGLELRSYGINIDFAPVLDVNNNPNNPIIGIRSYSDNPVITSLFGNNAIKGFLESNVIATAKHFPGHGNTSVDSHYGLPEIDSSLSSLYSIELAPFISAINYGIDAIMTTHIMFNQIDSQYPATLSKKVLTDLLRNTLGYNGLIITDGMEMDAIAKNFGTYAEAAVLAVKAGVDILTYTTLSSPIEAYLGIMEAVNNNEITEERINDSVRRILLKKIKYGICDNYLVTESDREQILIEHEKLNNSFSENSLTLVKGDFSGLDKTKTTLIISPKTSYSLGSGLKSNSLACYAYNYLNSKGHKCDYKEVAENISNNDSESIINDINKYEQIVVAFSNVKTKNYTRSANFVKLLTEKHQNVVVISLDTPYDLLAYGNNVDTYICVYGYQKATVNAIVKYLNGEFEAKGVLPINKNLFK